MPRSHERCPCGRPLHYPNAYTLAYMQRQVRRFGPTVDVETTEGTWRVPRHYLWLHVFRLWELPTLAAEYGWERVSNGNGHHVEHGPVEDEPQEIP